MAVKNALETLYPKVLSLALDQEPLQLKKKEHDSCVITQKCPFSSQQMREA